MPPADTTPRAAVRLPVHPAGFALVGAAAALAACSGPLDRSAEDQLRDDLIAAHREQLGDTVAGRQIQVARTPSDVERQLEEEGRIEQLDQVSGTTAYVTAELEPGDDLFGRSDAELVALPLEEAVRMAVRNNLDVAVARLGPAIAEQQVAVAEAVFDWTFFTDVDWQKLDTPQPAGVVTGFSGDVQQEIFTVNPGLTRRLPWGGDLTFETALSREERVPSQFITDRFYDADVIASISQPLLRGFGRDVAEADILLARNAREQQVQTLKEELLQTVLETHNAYWDLALARQNLLIQQRLLARTIDDRNRLVARAPFDVSPVRITEANSFVELRRAEVIRARTTLRRSSDRLKRLLNDDTIALTGEGLLNPTDRPAETPITFNLIESITAAFRHRPELERALLEVNDQAIRIRVAQNDVYPLLDLTAAVGVNGIDNDNAGDAYGNLADLDYIDYLLGGRFEYPLGNRGPQAALRAQRLVREQAVLDFRRLALDRVVLVKDALRQVMTAYELIGATRAARRAAADSLRAIEEQEAAGVALTPEFLLDLKFRTQERLALAEVDEAQALVDYNTAIAAYYESIGTLLDRYGIDFQQPPAE